MNVIALIFGLAALGIFLAAIGNIFKGRLGAAFVFGILALLMGSLAGVVEAGGL